MTILKESGGSSQFFPQTHQVTSKPRLKKRPTEDHDAQSAETGDEYGGGDRSDGGGSSSFSLAGRQDGNGLGAELGRGGGSGSGDEKRLTKKMRGVSLKDKFSLR